MNEQAIAVAEPQGPAPPAAGPMPEPTLAERCSAVSAAVQADRIRRASRIVPVRSLWPSMLGDPCERRVTYHKGQWKDRRPITPELQGIFDAGNMWGERTVRELQDAGLRVERTEQPWEIQPQGVSGRLDLDLVTGDGRGPNDRLASEVKSMSPHVFSAVSSVDDFRKSRYAHLRRYPGQLALTLHGLKRDAGVFILREKVTGAWKLLPMVANPPLVTDLLARADRVNAHVAAGTLPERIDPSLGHCESCDFAHVCLPDEAPREAA
ncbi:MAG: hypothetical protein Q8S13_01605, partial [Dehalococcoidia bacterium]|nr:hypothetical protein [Dehalococcoidia bacterium]